MGDAEKRSVLQVAWRCHSHNLRATSPRHSGGSCLRIPRLPSAPSDPFWPPNVFVSVLTKGAWGNKSTRLLSAHLLKV